jgi:hypothetical protein
MEFSSYLLMGLITGALFGAVLHKVGAVRYSRVEGLLLLKDLKILKFAFVGVGTASILYGLAFLLGVNEALNIHPRIMPYMGVAHILGGFLFGIAFAASGLCPGTCLARVGSGKWIAFAAVIGLILGIVIYDLLYPFLVDAGILGSKKSITIYGMFGLPYGVVAVVWGILFMFLAYLADIRDPANKLTHEEEKPKSFIEILKNEWHWFPSGVLAGLIIVWATMQGQFLGFSGSILSFVAWIAYELGHPLGVVPVIDETIMWRAGLAIGVIPGAFISSYLSQTLKFDVVPPSFATAVSPIPWVRLGLVFFGGVFLALGAMIGGGCTTGAFLAAYPTLSVGSLIQSGTFFIVGVLTANLIYFGRWHQFLKSKPAADMLYD